MKKLIFVLLFMSSLKSIGQDYKAKITSFRQNYIQEFLQDNGSPLKAADIQFLRFYDADSTYKVIANVSILSNQDPFVISTFSTGTGGKHLRYAVVKFTLNGKPMELTVYRNLSLSNIPAYKDYLFLPFTDETNGTTTYGGGRYIDLHEGDFKNGTLELDFNKAYNPYCAFGGNYVCPKPPSENNLSIAIAAGEKMFAREIKHQN